MEKSRINLSFNYGWFACLFQGVAAKTAASKWRFGKLLCMVQKNARQAVAVGFHERKKPLEEWSNIV